MEEQIHRSSYCVYVGLILLVCLHVIYTDKTCSESYDFMPVSCFPQKFVLKLEKSKTVSIGVTSVYDCAMSCDRNKECHSFHFDRFKSVCELYRLNVTANDQNLMQMYHEKTTEEEDCDCYVMVAGKVVYSGVKNTTMSGIKCQRWDSHSPHEHVKFNTPQLEPCLATAQNFCRDTDNTGEPWCYTTDPNIRFENCSVPLC